jgi:hypothetical protein
VQLRHGRGVRIPGVFQNRGYVVTKGRGGTRYVSPVILESKKGFEVDFGLFGSPPTNPGLVVRTEAGRKLDK